MPDVLVAMKSHCVTLRESAGNELFMSDRARGDREERRSRTSGRENIE